MAGYKDSIETPPHGELTDFDTFASAMTTAPLDDLHKYFDSDDEQDLEDNYDGDDSDKENEDGFDGLEYTNDPPNAYFEDADNSDHDPDNDDHNVNDYGHTKGYEYFDPRLDIDLSKLRPSHAASRHLNPHLQKTIDKTELMLEQLSIQAQSMVEEQPMSTQIILANQALEHIFKPYGMHGSQAQFSASVMKFLAGGDTVRRPGNEGRDKSKDGKLRFAEVGTATTVDGEGKEKREKLKRKASGEEKLVSDIGEGGVKIKVPRVQVGDDVVAVKKHLPKDTESKETTHRADDANVFGERVGYGFQSASTVPLEGSWASVDSLSFRKTSGPLDMKEAENNHTLSSNSTSTSTTSEPNLYLDEFEAIKLKLQDQAPRNPFQTYHYGPDNTLTSTSTPTTSRTPFTPLASTFSQSLRLQTPSTSTLPSSTLPQHHQQQPNYACTHDPASNAALSRAPYNPISLRLSWPATTRSSARPCMPTPGLLDSLNNIVHLTNAEARFMLSYYVRKYEGPVGQAANGSGGAPHALFRLGIAQYLMSRVGKVVDHKESDALGLNPEARRVLGEVWEQHPSTRAWFDEGLVGGEGGGRDEFEAGDYEGADNNLDAEPDLVMSEDDDVDDVENGTASPSTPYRRRSNSNSSRVNHTPTPTRTTDGLNPLEKALLARACNVSVETVDAYWDDMRWKTRGWGAMKAWCTAQDKMRIARVKAEGRW